MPKIAQQNVSAQHQERFTRGLRSYFCVCQEFALVMDRRLDKLARRTTDGAYILRNEDSEAGKKTTYKLNATTDSKAVLIKREGSSLEKQWRLRCTRCDLIIGYQVKEPKAVKQGLVKQPYTYLVAGALTDQQATLPADAFDLDPVKTMKEAAALSDSSVATGEAASTLAAQAR